MNELNTDVLIIGSGGAGLFAALRASSHPAAPEVKVMVKGSFGKSGCTRMVQGGFNAALQPDDSPVVHLRDTIVGGAFLNNQELARVLTEDARERVLELSNELGVRFDRDAQGDSFDFKPFGGMSIDRTVHRGDLTGIEIVSRLADHVMSRPNVSILEEHRALEVLHTPSGDRAAGILALDMRSGDFTVVKARTVLIATGGGARMYRYSSPSTEKSGDGIAMAFRAGVELMDMEMLQFHPTGLLAGDSILTGSVVEEGLRGAGGHLRNAVGERFMSRYDPERMERSTRDQVSRAIYREVDEGRGTPQGGVYLDVSHLGADRIASEFPGMTQRASLAGRDLTTEPIEVVPTGHFHMGGARIDLDGNTAIEGLWIAGEDAGGVHGANRLGGNGVAESTVFGARAGSSMAEAVTHNGMPEVDEGQVDAFIAVAERRLGEPGKSANPYHLRKRVEDAMWAGAGVIRDAAGLGRVLEILESIESDLGGIQSTGSRAYNLMWNEALNLANIVVVARLLCISALARTESRGAHFRSDYPEQNNEDWLRNVVVSPGEGDTIETSSVPVELTHLAPH